ncbi:heterokaryon incompatibility protein-domain-containing protein [Xylaria longipes]|nr:heterokaryon incompatibility protein-domain-containing protein [Xylaria longipes]
MRFLQLTPNGDLSLTRDLTNNLPEYAILSHTWGDDEDEVLFDDIINHSAKDKAGYRKIKFCMEQATLDQLQFVWVDTCCIKKSDSTELAMAINSMFRWYKNASRCYVYLGDVLANGEEPDPDMSEGLRQAIRESRWFTRGWTLQELIAPRSVEFYSSDGGFLGDKESLEQMLWEITRIPARALRGCDLSEFTIAERMSWASTRETKLEEDKIYSLLGIFDIHLPLIYGEGQHYAQERLRFEIQRRTTRQEQPIPEQLGPNIPVVPPQSWHPVRRNYNRVHVKVIYWKIDQVDDLVTRLSDVFRKLYFYEVEIVCLTPGYPVTDLDIPWKDSKSISDKDLQIVYYIGATQLSPDLAAKGWPDIQAVSHTLPHQTLEKQDWLSLALGIPMLRSDVLVILDCYWAKLCDNDSADFGFLDVGDNWARYAVIFAGYEDEAFSLGQFSENFISILEHLAHSVGDFNALSSCQAVIEELKARGHVHPEGRGTTGSASIILAPLWA